MDIESIIKQAGDLTLITSAEQANKILADLNTIIADLRMTVNEKELAADLLLNEMFAQPGAIEKVKAMWRTSEPYKEWKTKAGLLSDVRAVRRLLERHSELLSSQERFGTYSRAIK